MSCCEHIELTDESVAVIAPKRGAINVECPCCHLPGQVEPGDSLDGMRCPYCDVEAVRSVL